MKILFWQIIIIIALPIQFNAQNLIQNGNFNCSGKWVFDPQNHQTLLFEGSVAPYNWVNCDSNGLTASGLLYLRDNIGMFWNSCDQSKDKYWVGINTRDIVAVDNTPSNVWGLDTGVGHFFMVLGLFDDMDTCCDPNYSVPTETAYNNSSISQTLKSPLEKYSCYNFSAFTFSYVFNRPNINNSLKHNFHPCCIKIWGGTNTCSREKLLYVSKPIRDTVWTLKQFQITTDSIEYSNILIEPCLDTGSAQQLKALYDGMLFLDSLILVKSGRIDSIDIDTVYYKGDGKTYLHAEYGLNYYWKPVSNLSDDTIQGPLMLKYQNHENVLIDHGKACPDLEMFNILLDCDSLIKKDSVVTEFYKYFKNVSLEAIDGTKYDWNPKRNLSAYNIQSPYLTAFEPEYIATIYDIYNCPSTEKFEIKTNCDSLVVDHEITIMDTILSSNPYSIQLVPKFGNVSGNWLPDIWLSCNTCQSPLAIPVNSVTYSVNIVDSFLCNFNEIFKISIPINIPNVFTPNGDGYNDEFKIVGLPSGTSIKIFDKNGMLVFKASQYNDNNFWKGEDMHGVPLQTGNYWYILSNKDLNFLKKGFILLLR